MYIFFLADCLFLRRTNEISPIEGVSFGNGPKQRNLFWRNIMLETPSKTKSLLLSATELGLMVQLSARQIFRLNSSGKIPAPLKIGGAVRWAKEDIEKWISLGCPDRKTFKARMEVK